MHAAENFISDFERQHGRALVPFFNGSYKNAAAEGRINQKLLLIYIHSPLHEDADKFSEQTLCAATVLETINDHFVLWGCVSIFS
jgi:FAS-associated factor 2